MKLGRIPLPPKADALVCGVVFALLAFSYLNDSWPGTVALGVALFGFLGWIAYSRFRRPNPSGRDV
jgi:hypothetical protein